MMAHVISQSHVEAFGGNSSGMSASISEGSRPSGKWGGEEANALLASFRARKYVSASALRGQGPGTPPLDPLTAYYVFRLQVIYRDLQITTATTTKTSLAKISSCYLY